MRAAPPVAAPLGSGQPERMVITLLHALAGGVLAMWLAQHAGWRTTGALGGAVLAAGAVLAVLGHRLAARALPATADALTWDGQTWRLGNAAATPLRHVVVAVDLGLWMLLRLHPAPNGDAQWRVASAQAAGSAWHGLRVALSAHAGAAHPALPEAPS